MSDLIERAKKLLVPCGIHDYGLAMECTCPECADPRPVISALLTEIKLLTDSEDSRLVVLEAERDRLKAAAEKAEAELERAEPVLDAADAWRGAFDNSDPLDPDYYTSDECRLAAAVDERNRCPICGPGGCAGHTEAVAEVKRRCPEALDFPDEAMVVRCVRDAHPDDLHWNRDRVLEWGELAAEGLSTDTTGGES